MLALLQKVRIFFWTSTFAEDRGIFFFTSAVSKPETSLSPGAGSVGFLRHSGKTNVWVRVLKTLTEKGPKQNGTSIFDQGNINNYSMIFPCFDGLKSVLSSCRSVLARPVPED